MTVEPLDTLLKYCQLPSLYTGMSKDKKSITISAEMTSSATSAKGTSDNANLSSSSHKGSMSFSLPSHKSSSAVASLDEPGVEEPTAESLATSKAL